MLSENEFYMKFLTKKIFYVVIFHIETKARNSFERKTSSDPWDWDCLGSERRIERIYFISTSFLKNRLVRETFFMALKMWRQTPSRNEEQHFMVNFLIYPIKEFCWKQTENQKESLKYEIIFHFQPNVN